MGGDDAASHVWRSSAQQPDQQAECQRQTEQHRGNNAKRAGTHGVAAPWALQCQDQQAKPDGARQTVNDTHDRLPR